MQPSNLGIPLKGPRTPKAKSSRPQSFSANQRAVNGHGQHATPATGKEKHRRHGSSTHHDGAVSDTPRNNHSDRMTPATNVAYAGPTFHASPAASNLPLPKFLSKSSSDTPVSRLQARMDAGESDCNDLTTQTEEDEDGDSDASPLVREESPLDFFFKAQRAERQKNSSPLALGSTSRPSSRTPTSTQRAAHSNLRPQKTPVSSSKAMFMMEIDGATDGPESDGPISSMSFHDRLRAASSNNSPSSMKTPDRGDQDRQVRSQELKRLLSMQVAGDEAGFSGNQASANPNVHYSPVSYTGSPASRPSKAQMPPPPNPEGSSGFGVLNLEEVLRASARKSSQQPRQQSSQPQRPPTDGVAPAADIQQMEDSLKKMLKLG